jgi:hypothetical protein
MGEVVLKTEVFGTQQCQLCSINHHFYVMSQLVTGVNRFSGSGGTGYNVSL